MLGNLVFDAPKGIGRDFGAGCEPFGEAGTRWLRQPHRTRTVTGEINQQ
jgi:hypothetical protein